MSEQKIVYPIVESSLPSSWKDFTVVIATVGVGNVSQLACDLLVYNLNCKLISNLDFQFLPAVVGCDPYWNSDASRTPSLMTCSQLYANENLKLAIIQFRAPPFPGCRRKHVKELVSFLRSANFARVVAISSSFAMQRKDAEIMESQLRYATSELFSPTDCQLLKAKKWPALIPFAQEVLSGLAEGSSKTTYYLPGSGIASYLFDECCGPTGLPICLVNCFASEGDNAGDALFVVQKLSDLLGLLPESKLTAPPHDVWRAPSSWCMLYGNDGDECLY